LPTARRCHYHRLLTALLTNPCHVVTNGAMRLLLRCTDIYGVRQERIEFDCCNRMSRIEKLRWEYVAADSLVEDLYVYACQ
jgi:hypothetical protein